VGLVVNLVVIETATPACAVALATAEGEFDYVGGESRHTETLVPELETLLARAGIGAQDLDRVVVDRGPGLFTGLRVGLATAIGLSLATGAGLVGVTSLELLAYGARTKGVRGRVVSCVDGRRGEVFVQSFDVGDDVRALDEPAVLHSSALSSYAERGLPVTLTGDGVVRYAEVVKGLEGAEVFTQLVPPALEGLALGRRRDTSEVVTPLYLRDADAVANFTTRDAPR